MINAILIVLIFALAIIFILYVIQKIKQEETEEIIEVNEKTYTLDKMSNFIKKRLDEITKINLYDIGLSEEELKRRKNKKYELKRALKGCTYGDANDKKYVKELIYDILYKEYGVDETNISKAIPFDVPSLLTSKDKFDIILFKYKEEFGNEALTEIINKYKLADLRYSKDNTKPCYVINDEDINNIFEKENFILTYEDKLRILVQRIYESYKGFSVIDEIREMNIDGVSRTEFLVCQRIL